MKKNFIMAVLAVFVMMSGGNICKAADVQTDVQHPESEYNSVLPEDVQGPPSPPPEHFAPGHSQNMKKPPHFKGKHPSKKEMEAKKAAEAATAPKAEAPKAEAPKAEETKEN